MPKIETLYAYITESAPDDEGLVAMLLGETWMPLVGADMDRMKSLKAVAEETSRVTGKEIILAKFEVRTDLEVMRP